MTDIDAAFEKFVTGVGLITSNGPHGHNIMAAEWTHHISYDPFLIGVNIHPWDATAQNIKKTKVFGVNIVADNQATISSVSGNYHGQEYDKIAALKDLGYKFYKGKKINVIMVKDAALNAECKVIKKMKIGDHVMFVGKVVSFSVGKLNPVAYNAGRYWLLNKNAPKPSDDERARIRAIVEKHRK